MLAQRLALLAWTVIALAIAVGSSRLGVGSFETPGPGFMPFLAAMLILGSVAAGAALGVRHADLALLDFTRWRRPGLGLAALVVYALGFTRLGFVPATFLLMVFLFRVAGVARWTAAVTLGALAAVGAWFLFGLGLSAQLPRGVLGF